MPEERSRIYTFFVVKEPSKPERILVWDTQDITIGRSPENDLTVDHAEMSRRHAVFTRTAKTYVVRNHSTSNSTYVNDQPVKTATLANKDRIKIAELEMIFYQVPRNPATVDAPVEYASQLKGFGATGDAGSSSPDATMLGLMDTVESDDDFVVGPARDFEYDLHDELKVGLDAGPAPRDLDQELASDPGMSATVESIEREPWSLEDDAAAAAPAPRAKPAAPAPQATPVAAGSGDVLSLTLEIAGLGAEQRRVVEGLLGKVIALPALKIRLKGGDLG